MIKLVDIYAQKDETGKYTNNGFLFRGKEKDSVLKDSNRFREYVAMDRQRALQMAAV